jgi:hypothetical protein
VATGAHLAEEPHVHVVHNELAGDGVVFEGRKAPQFRVCDGSGLRVAVYDDAQLLAHCGSPHDQRVDALGGEHAQQLCMLRRVRHVRVKPRGQKRE